MKTNSRRIAAVGLAVLLILLAASRFQACLWPRSFARAQAFRHVKQLCAQDHRDSRLLSDARDITVSGAHWAFEWTYEGKPRYVYGIRISCAGDLKVFGGDPDDPQSAAYVPKT
jgi:hypothetical protein